MIGKRVKRKIMWELYGKELKRKPTWELWGKALKENKITWELQGKELKEKSRGNNCFMTRIGVKSLLSA